MVRLVNKRLHDISWRGFGTCLSWRTFSVHNKKDLSDLEAISEHKDLPRYILTLTFGCGRVSNEYVEYFRSIPVNSGENSLLSGFFLNADEHYMEQKHGLSSAYILKTLTRSFERFTNLRKLSYRHITFPIPLRSPQDISEEENDRFCEISVHLLNPPTEKFAELNVLFTILQNADISLKELNIPIIYNNEWAFGYASSMPAIIIIAPSQYLKELRQHWEKMEGVRQKTLSLRPLVSGYQR